MAATPGKPLPGPDAANDKTKQQDSGGPITRIRPALNFTHLIFAVTESPKQKGVIWDTDDGLIQITVMTANPGTQYLMLKAAEWAMVVLIEASPFDAGNARLSWINLNRIFLRPQILEKVGDAAHQWIAGNVLRARRARRSQAQRHALSRGNGHLGFLRRWRTLANIAAGLHDMIIYNDDLLVATHGRAFWSLDNIDPLRQMNASVTNEDGTPVRAFHGEALARRPRRVLRGENQLLSGSAANGFGNLALVRRQALRSVRVGSAAGVRCGLRAWRSAGSGPSPDAVHPATPLRIRLGSQAISDPARIAGTPDRRVGLFLDPQQLIVFGHALAAERAPVLI